MQISGKSWFVAQVSGAVELASESVKREGFRVYAPKIGHSRIYPGYLFTEIRDMEDVCVINRCRGVISVLPIRSENPRPLPLGFVENLMEMVEGGYFSDEAHEALVKRFVPGELVVATVGPMRGRAGRFLRHNKGCGIVLGYLLRREIEYRVPLESLEHA